MLSSPSSPRYLGWSSILAFSAIALGSYIAAWPDDSDMREDFHKWAMSVFAITTGLSFFGVVAHFTVQDMFVGKIPEAGLSTLILIFWVVGLPAIMKPSNMIAVKQDFTISSANIYFSAWFAFISSLFVCGHMAEEKTGQKFGNTNPKTMKWFGLIAASLIVLGSASQIFTDVNCDDDNSLLKETDFCKRTKYAVSLGVVAAVLAFVMILLTGCGRLPRMLELVVSVILAIMYGFGVAYVTFGDEGKSPGRTIGNLYFSTWIGFLVSFLLAAECVTVGGERDVEDEKPIDGHDKDEGSDEESPAEQAPPEEEDEPDAARQESMDA